MPLPPGVDGTVELPPQDQCDDYCDDDDCLDDECCNETECCSEQTNGNPSPEDEIIGSAEGDE